jgi:2-polyprenyl-3-methyl-5-hydroxy-6-metoxy-1,4-benzoquinol methylase
MRHKLEMKFQKEREQLRQKAEADFLCEKELLKTELESQFQGKMELYHHKLHTAFKQKIDLCLREVASLSPLEEAVFNEGERLIPERSHEEKETERHKSSYRFFRHIIDRDLLHRKSTLPISILDIGSGCGHGSYELSKITGVQVTGVDIEPHCIDYARVHYSADNVTYEIIGDIFEYAKTMKPFDYIVSRHVFEHIPDAFSLIEKLRWTKRLLINVPFAEKPGNPFHLLLNIREDSFPPVKAREFFYEDLAGRTYVFEPEGVFINSICCCYTNEQPDIAKNSADVFPFQPWKPEGEHAIVRSLYRKLTDSLRNF